MGIWNTCVCVCGGGGGGDAVGMTMGACYSVHTVNSRYSGHPWDYPKWLEYRGGHISGYLEIPAAIFETVSRSSSPACKVIVTG